MIFRKIIEALVYSNIWISAGALCFAWFFYMLNKIEADPYFLAFIFFSTLLTYTFQRFMKIYYHEKLQGPRMEWMESQQKLVKFILFIGLIGSLVFCLFLNYISILVLSVLGAISFLYAFKFNLTKRQTNLRDIPGIKIYLIGLVWALSCGIIPAIEAEIHNLQVVMICLGFFLFIVGITIPFDIRDIDYDELNKKTIPQLFGMKLAKLIAVLLILAAYFALSYPNMYAPGLIAGLVVSGLLIVFTRKRHDELYFSFVLDGLLVFVPGIYYLDQIL